MMEINNYTIENMIGYDINRAAIILRKKLTARLKNEGIDLTPEEFAILSRLWEDEGILQNLLVEKTLKDKTRVARLLNNLKEKSLIHKEINPHDKRKQFVFLTSQGRTLEATVVPIVTELMKQAGHGVSAEDLQITKNVLNRFFLNLNDVD